MYGHFNIVYIEQEVYTSFSACCYRYSTFFRTIPSDTVIARAMANLVQNRKWQYVITLNSPDVGSRAARDKFQEYLKVGHSP